MNVSRWLLSRALTRRRCQPRLAPRRHHAVRPSQKGTFDCPIRSLALIKVQRAGVTSTVSMVTVCVGAGEEGQQLTAPLYRL